MDNITWIGVVGVLLLAMQCLNLYNSAHTASKNAHEPFDRLEKRIGEIEGNLKVMGFDMERIKTDINHAHDKIRKNEESMNKITKAQNKALLAMLLWIKEPQHNDSKRIDDAINEISNL